LKILYVTDSYPPVLNGVSDVVNHLAKGMAERGHSVEVATIDDTGALPRKEVVSGVTVKRFLGFRPARSYHVPTPGILRVLNEEFDVIHVHNFHSVLPLVFSAPVFQEQRRALLVVTPHFHVPGHHSHSRFAWVIYKQLLRNRIHVYDVVQCVSQLEAERVQHFFGVRPVVVENGVDCDVFDYSWRGYPNGRVNITFVGRLERYKRADLVLRAAHVLNSRGVSTTVNIVGSGPEEASLVSLSNTLGVGLEIRNRLSRSDLLALVSRSACLVNPSQYEAYSLAVAEALAMGVPAVVVGPWGTNFAKYRRVRIVEPLADSLAGGILDAISNKDEGKNAIPTWDDMVDLMCERVYSSRRMTRSPSEQLVGATRH
jgi:glycosyltransferase involved in cell wall biosynthesis